MSYAFQCLFCVMEESMTVTKNKTKIVRTSKKFVERELFWKFTAMKTKIVRVEKNITTKQKMRLKIIYCKLDRTTPQK